MRTLVKVLLGLSLLAVVAAAGAWLFYGEPRVAQLRAPGTRDGEITLEVPAGASMKTVLGMLEKAGIVKDARAAYYYVRYTKVGAPKTGEYRIPAAASALEVLEKMHRGEVATYEIGFPEGLTYKEIAERVEATGLIKGAELIALCEDEAFLKSLNVPGKTCEGYLFPDTYRVARNRPAKEIVALFINHFHELYKKNIEPFEAGSLLKSKRDIVTLASIVEKETGAKEERPHIAGLFLNRVKKGMRLETDPTVIYAAILAGSYDGNIHKSDLLRDHPYNTYKRAGLPPGPISNPGLKALEAVVKPMTSEDLFFVSRNDGTHVFCPTLDCHEAAVDKWQRQYFRKNRKTKQ